MFVSFEFEKQLKIEFESAEYELKFRRFRGIIFAYEIDYESVEFLIMLKNIYD